MRQDVVFFTLAILLVLSIYLVIAGQGINFWRKVLILIMTVAAALCIYFGARDLLGRPTPFVRPGKYFIEHALIDDLGDRVYVFISGGENDFEINPRLLVVPRKWFSQTGEEIGKVLDRQRHGYRSMIEIKGNSWYGERGGATIETYDPLGRKLPPKQIPHQ